MKDQTEKFLDAYNLYSDQIFRFVLFKLNDRSRALDFTQETFMKTWIHISSGKSVENMRAFLYRIAGNLVIDEYRKKERKNSQSLDSLIIDGFEPPMEEGESVADSIDGKEALLLVKKLPHVYSEVLFMKYVEGLHISEIASIIGVSANIVSVRINRGIKKLKILFQNKSHNHYG